MNSLPNVSGNFVWASLYLKRERFASMMAPLFENSLHKNSTKNITPLSISCPTGFSPNPPCLLSLQGWAPRSHFLSWLVFGNLARKLWGTTSSINTLYWVTLRALASRETRRIVWKDQPSSVVGGACLIHQLSLNHSDLFQHRWFVGRSGLRRSFWQGHHCRKWEVACNGWGVLVYLWRRGEYV